MKEKKFKSTTKKIRKAKKKLSHLKIILLLYILLIVMLAYTFFANYYISRNNGVKTSHTPSPAQHQITSPPPLVHNIHFDKGIWSDENPTTNDIVVATSMKTDPINVETAPEGVKTTPEGVETSTKGVETTLKGVETTAKAVEAAPKSVETVPKEVEDQEYYHSLHPVFPLAGGLTNPIPDKRLGKKSNEADILIGVTTVKRDTSYLKQTLTSLINNMYDSTTENNSAVVVKIVVFIGEIDDKFVNSTLKEIQKDFSHDLNNGVLEVIVPPKHYYPETWTNKLHMQFGESFEKIKWRSKQNLDQIFLIMYIYNLQPKFYLMMEDDVIATTMGYPGLIMKFAIESEDKDWFHLSFCYLGSIGKLYRLRTLPSLASFIHTFWNRKPLDWIQLDYITSHICNYDLAPEECVKRYMKQPIFHYPSLFEHKGIVSSLKLKGTTNQYRIVHPRGDKRKHNIRFRRPSKN